MIKEYTKKDGSKAYMFVAYLGTDPLTGKQKRTTRRGFKTKREAKIAEAKLQNEIIENGFKKHTNITFSELFYQWFEIYKTTVKDSSARTTKIVFTANLIPKLGNIKITNITTQTLQEVIVNLSETHKNIYRFKKVLKLLLDYAVDINILKDNPVKKVKLPKIETIKDDKETYYTKEELNTFLSFFEHDIKYHTIFRVLAYTGIRKGELLALRWEDVDYNKKTLRINKTVSVDINGKDIISTTKTKSSNRVISLDIRTLSILKKWQFEQKTFLLSLGYNANNESQFIFSNMENHFLSNTAISKKMKAVCKKHNFKCIKLHGFRHTHCSLLFEAGVSIQEAQSRLGHSNINTTMNIYAHVTDKQKENVAEKFDKYMTN